MGNGLIGIKESDIMDEFISFLVFEDYTIERCFFQINDNFNTDDEVSVRPRFHVEHTHMDDNKVSVSLTCIINEKDFSEGGDYFYLEIKLKGDFIIDDQNDRLPEGKEVIHDVINLNTVAILFPYLRSAVTNITSIANIEPLILPPINIHRLLGSNED